MSILDGQLARLGALEYPIGEDDRTRVVPTENVWPAPSASSFSDLALGSLHQRIRPVGVTPAKMEFRASWSS